MAHPQTPRVFQKHKVRVPVHSDELLDLLRFRFPTEQQVSPIPFLVCAGPAVPVQVQAHMQVVPHTATLQPLFPAPLPHFCSIFSPRQFGWLSPHHRSGGIVLTTGICECRAGCTFTEPLGSPGLSSRSPTSMTAAVTSPAPLPPNCSILSHSSSHTSFSGDPTCHFDADEPQLTAPLALPYLLHDASTQLTPGDDELHMSRRPPHPSLSSTAICVSLPPPLQVNSSSLVPQGPPRIPEAPLPSQGEVVYTGSSP